MTVDGVTAIGVAATSSMVQGHAGTLGSKLAQGRGDDSSWSARCQLVTDADVMSRGYGQVGEEVQHR